ncbi:MAG: DNA starvation/stationary phase protection protein Dps [Myxococcales bacterium]|nr:DNA starvation/stationary phase protection protein Dps [Myxococcales bacterium]
MFKSPSSPSEPTRATICQALSDALADGLDLHSHVKVAHWNIKGPHFAALHALFDSFADSLSGQNDELAERIVTLGGRALGTTRHVAKTSRLAEYPSDVTRDLDHVRLLAERFGSYLAGLRAARSVAKEGEDSDSEDLLTGILRQTEKHTWFLISTLE